MTYWLKLEKDHFRIGMEIRDESGDFWEDLFKDNEGRGVALHMEDKMSGLASID